MVRITLPNRLKSYTGGGTNSTNHSRSTSPNHSSSMKKNSAVADGSPEKANGLMLKIVVIKVGLHFFGHAGRNNVIRVKC